MSKCILVMDIPKSCLDCPCRGFADICNLKNKDCKYNAKRPKWCPLKPIPQKIGVDEAINMPRNGNIVDVINSYNACIAKILGGGE